MVHMIKREAERKCRLKREKIGEKTFQKSGQKKKWIKK